MFKVTPQLPHPPRPAATSTWTSCNIHLDQLQHPPRAAANPYLNQLLHSPGPPATWRLIASCSWVNMAAWIVWTLAGFVGEGVLHNVVSLDGLLLGWPELQNNRSVLDLVTSVGDQDISIRSSNNNSSMERLFVHNQSKAMFPDI